MAVSRDRAETVTLTTCFALRSQRHYSSSWMVRVQISGEETRQIDYRNDPVKYDLNFTTVFQGVFEWYERTVLCNGRWIILVRFPCKQTTISQMFSNRIQSGLTISIVQRIKTNGIEHYFENQNIHFFYAYTNLNIKKQRRNTVYCTGTPPVKTFYDFLRKFIGSICSKQISKKFLPQLKELNVLGTCLVYWW